MTLTGKSIRGPRRKMPWTRKLVLAALLLVMAWLIASFAVAWFALKRRHPRFAEPAPDIAWGNVESVRLDTRDGEQIGGWFIAGSRGVRPVVLLLHGHNGRRGDCLPQAHIFASAGCSTLLISLRANGDSTGEVNDVGYSARADVLAAVDWIERCHAGRPIVIYGQSMGAAAALFAAPELGHRVHGYILESPYKDLRTAVWNRTRFYLPMGLDFLAYAGLVTTAPLLLPYLDSIAPVNEAAKMPEAMSVLVLAGGADRRAELAEAQAICDQMPQATLVVIDGADHGALLATDPAAFRTALLGFLARWGQGG